MRTLSRLKKNIAKIGLLLLVIAITSCDALKRVGDNELLLTKNNVYANNEKVVNEDIQSLIVQKPNSTVLGYPLRLNLYNLAKVNPDSSFQTWLYKKDKRKERLTNLLSEKQVARLGESFIVKGTSEWLKKIGEPPTIIDSAKTNKSLQRLRAYYVDRGFFNNEVTFEIDSSNRKNRASVAYNIALGKPYILDAVSHKISSPVIDSIFQLHASKSHIVSGKQFDFSDFNKERERLTLLFRDSGVYNFQESSIDYNVDIDTIQANNDQLMNVQLNIEDLKRRGENTVSSEPYKVYRFDKVNIYADYNFDSATDVLQSVEYDNYTIYYKDKLRYKPKALTDAVFMEKDSVYRDIDKVRTYRQITNLNTFRYPNIDFVEDSLQNKLNANIYLSARKKFSLGFNFDIIHSNIQTIGTGFGASLITRNIFGGAETMGLSVRGSFGLLSDESLTDKFFTEIGGDINLTFPRIWFPINTKNVIPYYMLPQTQLTIGTSFQKNIGLDKQTFNTILGYNWTPSDNKKHNIELLNLQFVRNLDIDDFFRVFGTTYTNLNDVAISLFENAADPTQLQPFFDEVVNDPEDLRLSIPEGANNFIEAVTSGTLATGDPDEFEEVRSIEERRDRLTENNLIFASSYTLNKDNKSSINDNSFYQYRFKIETAGNLLSGIANIINFNENEDGNKLVFDVPYSQYVKTEFDFIKHWDLSRANVLAFHSFFGIAIPYGNADNIPFTRSYFGGGSNDNRAWFPYSLGPGRTRNLNDFNEANLKLAMNLEYRFPVAGNIKGALFADAGNIWNVFDNVEDPDATFNGFSSLADIALGTGFGLRYDFSYFIFRVDAGFKTYNPAEEPAKRWFREYNFANAIFQIGINYPF